jgi:D-alanyl-D-alanine carboxypeptidase/D-alanyl-D-alanine-endopeptidase (penicillin-binding protein 4)
MTGADHANNIPTAAPLPGDPLRTVRDIATEVAARGVTRIDGRVLVDVSLFRGRRNGSRWATSPCPSRRS